FLEEFATLRMNVPTVRRQKNCWMARESVNCAPQNVEFRTFDITFNQIRHWHFTPSEEIVDRNSLNCDGLISRHVEPALRRTVTQSKLCGSGRVTDGKRQDCTILHAV